MDGVSLSKFMGGVTVSLLMDGLSVSAWKSMDGVSVSKLMGVVSVSLLMDLVSVSFANGWCICIQVNGSVSVSLVLSVYHYFLQPSVLFISLSDSYHCLHHPDYTIHSYQLKWRQILTRLIMMRLHPIVRRLVWYCPWCCPQWCSWYYPLYCHWYCTWHKNCVLEILWFKKSFGSKNFLVRKIVGCENLGLLKFWVWQKFWV